jgi:hypothetical protein
MRGRISERIDTNIFVKFFLGNELRSGVVKNISENGMFILTDVYFPFHSQFEIIITSDKGVFLTLPVEMCRIQKHGDHYNGIGVVVEKKSAKYLDFVQSLKSSLIAR